MSRLPDQTPPLWPFLLLCLGAAVCIDLGTLHREEHADSLINILMSLYAWTPFFWGQDRYGALLPLLALPFRHPLANLLFQEALSTGCGLAAFFLLARYLYRGPAYPLVAAISAAAFLLLTPTYFRFEYLVDCCYGQALALGLGGLLVALPDEAGRINRRRCIAALGLLALAHWVYLGSALLLGPLVVLRGLLAPYPPSGRESRTGLGLVLGGLACGVFLARTLGDRHGGTPLGASPLEQWPSAWGQLAVNTWEALAPQYGPFFLLALAALGLLLLGNRICRGHAAWTALAIAVGAGLGKTLFLGTRQWTAVNLFPFRYVLPAFVFVQVAGVGLAVVPLMVLAGPRFRRLLNWSTGPALLLAAVAAYGWPSLPGVRTDLEARLGAHTPAVLRTGCTHVAGEYGRVWKTVFLANLVRYEQGETLPLWGVAYRGGALAHRWRRQEWPAVVVGVPVEDEAWLRENAPWIEGLARVGPLMLVERQPGLLVYRGDAPTGERRPSLLRRAGQFHRGLDAGGHFGQDAKPGVYRPHQGP
jgi:hypothetical protein